MEVQELIGGNLRRAREERGLTQAQLGEGLGPLLGKPLARQAVYSAETGGRAFTAVDLVALSVVLQKPVWWFFLPSAGPDMPVELPTGERVSGSDITGLVLDVERAAYLGGVAGSVDGHLREIEKQVSAVRYEILRLAEAGMRGDA
jgi:transcriptional regulator with XRE-family HTH domain